jgi:SpoIID/LytB domain protein
LFALALALAVPVLGGGGVHADALPISDSVVRVHLSSYGAPASIAMEAIGSHKIADNDISLSGKFTAAVSGGKIKITAGDAVYDLDADVTIKAESATVSDQIKIKGNYSYVGDFRLIVKNGGLKIVNSVDFETYTVGVLPYEMSNSWPLEALKAQAVAARTYAYAAANSRSRAGQEHDVVNTTSSQVYYGYNAANKNCIEAVSATANQILTDKNGDAVYTFYSASNGGHTEYPKAARVAVSNPAYLPYKDDAHDLAYALASTVYSAKLTIPKSFSVDTLKSSSAQPYAMFRDKLAAAGAPAGKLKGTVKVKSIVLDTPRYSDPNRVFTGADITLTVTDTSGNTKNVKLSFECYKDSSGINRPFLNDVLNLSNKSKFSALYLKSNTNDFLLASVRYGHGAGMSQTGAYQMAKSQKTYRDILTFYYAMDSESTLLTKPWNIDNGITSLAETPAPAPVVKQPAATPAPAKFKSFKAKVTLPGKGGNLNVRKGPSTKNKILGKLKNKAKVTITGKSGSWYKLKYKGKTGYVSKKYIKKI